MGPVDITWMLDLDDIELDLVTGRRRAKDPMDTAACLVAKRVISRRAFPNEKRVVDLTEVEMEMAWAICRKRFPATDPQWQWLLFRWLATIHKVGANRVSVS